MSKRPQYSIITPSNGKRPKALAEAISSVANAIQHAALPHGSVEMLIGFDGVAGEVPKQLPDFVKHYKLPADNNWGNGIRQTLLKVCKGARVIFLDDDNFLMPDAFTIYAGHPAVEMLIARVDTSRAFADVPWLPQVEEGEELDSVFRHTNVDPLCLCTTRELVVDRCGGWQFDVYSADYLNMIRWYRRAKSVAITEQVVGIYDYGAHLDCTDFDRSSVGPMERIALEDEHHKKHDESR